MKEVKGLNFKGKTSDEPYYLLTIVGDENDGDYVTSKQTYNEKTFENGILPLLFELVGRYSGHHDLPEVPYAISEYLPIPSSEWDGFCHTLDEVTILYVNKEGACDVTLDKAYIEENLVDIIVGRVLHDIKENSIIFEDLFDWKCEDVMGMSFDYDYDELIELSQEELEEMYKGYTTVEAQVIDKLIKLAKEQN